MASNMNAVNSTETLPTHTLSTLSRYQLLYTLCTRLYTVFKHTAAVERIDELMSS